MSSDEKKSILDKARAVTGKYKAFWVAVSLSGALLTVVLNWKNIGPHFSRSLSWSIEDYLQKIDATIKEGIPQASSGAFRMSIAGGFETIPATRHPDDASIKYTIRAKKGDRIETGLSRIRNGYAASSWQYVFTVYEATKKEKRKMLEESGSFPTNSWKQFVTERGLEGRGDGTAEIQYVIKPKGIKSKLGSIIAELKGAPPYYKDFGFMVPNVAHKRKSDELNIILISFDTLRADHLGCYGYPKPTSPHIDSFARQAILFTQAISSSPWTTPSHLSLLSGLHPGAIYGGNEGPFAENYYSDKLIVGTLKNNGYYTIGITGGLFVDSSLGFGKGFNRYMEIGNITNKSDRPISWKPQYRVPKIFKKATEWIEANRDVKFFMFLHNFGCHDPYEDTFFLEQEESLGFLEQRIALYDGDIRRTEAFFGKLIEKLDSLDLLENTIIVLVSDHGEEFNDHYSENDAIGLELETRVPQISKVNHGHTVYDELIWVPAIFHFPGLRPNKVVLDNQIRLVDVMPTILDYLGIQYDGPIQGMSLVDLMRNGERSHDPPAISERTYFGPEQKSVRMGGYKYIYTDDPNKIKGGRTFPGIPRYAFYDLNNDPDEKVNVYARNKDLAKEYHEILQKTLEESLAINEELQRNSQKKEKGSATLPDNVVESLKALGYLE